MKKPLLATIGLAGACAACCAVPLLVPVISGLSVAGMVGVDWQRFTANQEHMAVVLGIAAAITVALGLWLARRRRAGQTCTPAASAQENRPQSSGSCGCGSPKSSVTMQ